VIAAAISELESLGDKPDGIVLNGVDGDRAPERARALDPPDAASDQLRADHRPDAR
jgi:hypothetical protein